MAPAQTFTIVAVAAFVLGCVRPTPDKADAESPPGPSAVSCSTRPTDSQSSPRAIIDYAGSRPTCRLEFTRVADFGRLNSGADISPMAVPVLDGRGRVFAIADNSSADAPRLSYQLLVFDTAGALLNVVGSQGSGPGEFEGLSPGIQRVTVGLSDSLFVFHSARLSVFAPDLAFARVVNLPAAVLVESADVLTDGRMLVGARFTKAGTTRQLIHMMDRHGEIVRSLGPEENIRRPGQQSGGAVLFALARDQRSLWVANGYGLEEYSTESGALLRQIDVENVAWLTETSAPPSEKISSHVRLSGVDDAGNIWMNGSRVRSKAIAPGAPPSERLEAAYFVDVVDPTIPAVIVRQVVPRPMQLLKDGKHALSGLQESDGRWVLTLWRFRMVRNE